MVVDTCNPELRRQRQEDHEFETSLRYTAKHLPTTTKPPVGGSRRERHEVRSPALRPETTSRKGSSRKGLPDTVILATGDTFQTCLTSRTVFVGICYSSKQETNSLSTSTYFIQCPLNLSLPTGLPGLIGHLIPRGSWVQPRGGPPKGLLITQDVTQLLSLSM
jgi:hypothetical protein